MPEKHEGRTGRPAGEPTQTVHLYIPLGLLARLDAQRGKLARVEVIRQAIEEYIAKRQEGNK